MVPDDGSRDVKLGWLDGAAGASGDMLLAALVDLGVPIELLQQHLDPLDLAIELRSDAVVRAGLAATKVHVDVPDTSTHRHLHDVVALLDRLPVPVRERAAATFERLARAEAEVHGTSIDEVHFHEVGALDSIADVVGVCAGFIELGLDELHCSTLSLGSGSTRGAHGPIPVPAPAVLAVLGGVAPVAAGPADYESTTPTGAALLAEWVTWWGPMPAMRIESTGLGAGTKDTDAVANVCRIVMGDADGDGDRSTMIQLDANVDDLDPRVWPEAIAAVMGAGAVDAWVTPIVMKKGRPAHTFSALASTASFDAVVASMFRETSTIGVRHRRVDRIVLERREHTIDHHGHSIRIKTASRDGHVVNQSVEWDDVVAAASTIGRAPNDVLRAVQREL